LRLLLLAIHSVSQGKAFHAAGMRYKQPVRLHLIGLLHLDSHKHRLMPPDRTQIGLGRKP
jgi:hypothetical protein